MKVPQDRDLEKITWVTNSRYPNFIFPNKMIFCKQCKGIIIFNDQELINASTHSTPCKYCMWHPSYPPLPWIDYDGKLEFETRKNWFERFEY
jgi:hypothetical protein